jgi:hypothetical protein
MKNQINPTNSIHRNGWLGSALAALILLSIAASSSAQVLPPSSLPYGYSYEEWSAKWWQFYMGQSTNHIEWVGNPDISRGPASRVRFLNGSPVTTTETRQVTIPAETPLFFAILGFVADNTACPVTAFTTNGPDIIAAEAAGGWSGAATLTTCTIDGVPVAGMDEPTNTIYNVVSPSFSYTTAEFGNVLGLVEGEPCIPGGLTIYPAVADGVYLMLSPLSPGKHTIHFVGVAGPLSAPFLKIDLTYDITVTRDRDGDRDRDDK